jgi:hypothetical protein
LEHAKESGTQESNELDAAKESKSHNNELEHEHEAELNESNETEPKELHEMELDELNETETNELHEMELDELNETESNDLHEMEVDDSNETELNELERANEIGTHEFNVSNGSLLNSAIERQSEEIKTILGNYGCSRNGLILMIREFNQDRQDTSWQSDIDEAQNLSIRDLLTLELDEQKNHDLELSQLNEDILQHINSTTEEIIDEIDRSEDSSLGNSPVNEFNCDYYIEPTASSEDDLNENTDTEDGAEEVIDLIQSNMKLMTVLDRQRTTISRLRARIFRLNDLITNLTSQLNSIRETTVNAPLHDTTAESAYVLVDSNVDASFLLRPNCNATAKTDHLYNPIIKKELETQLAKINKTKSNSQEELWMYFDSGASRSVITETSPIRSHIQAIKPTYGPCSIGDGTPLHPIHREG